MNIMTKVFFIHPVYHLSLTLQHSRLFYNVSLSESLKNEIVLDALDAHLYNTDTDSYDEEESRKHHRHNGVSSKDDSLQRHHHHHNHAGADEMSHHHHHNHHHTNDVRDMDPFKHYQHHHHHHHGLEDEDEDELEDEDESHRDPPESIPTNTVREGNEEGESKPTEGNDFIDDEYDEFDDDDDDDELYNHDDLAEDEEIMEQKVKEIAAKGNKCLELIL